MLLLKIVLDVFPASLYFYPNDPYNSISLDF